MPVGRNATFVWGLLGALASSVAAYGDQTKAYVFRGLEPGTTTADAVRSDGRWGQPANVEQADDGTLRWSYQPRGYRLVVVTLSGDRVQTVDVYLPGGVSATDAAAALKLGLPVEGADLGAAARVGPAVPETWEPVPYSAGRVVLFVDRHSNQARAMRSYAPELLGTTAAVAAPDESAAVSGPLKSLAGQDRDSRLIVATLVKILPQNHISRHPFDRAIVDRMQGILLDTLDGQQLYFTRPDVVEFRRGADRLRIDLTQGDLRQVYDLCETLIKRVGERAALVDDLLAGDFDFTVDEQYVGNPQGDVWAENELESREAWRKRVKYELLTHLEAGADLEEAKSRVARAMHSLVEQWRKVDDGGLFSQASAALFGAYDPRSAYYSPREWRDMVIRLRSQMVGIGASLKVQDGYVEVDGLVAGSPSEQDGRLKPGDRIVGVGQGVEGEMVDVVGMKLAESVELIRGAEGTTVRLRVLPKDGFESTIVDLKRGRFELQRIGSVVLDADDAGRQGQAKVGYIYLPTIYSELNPDQADRENIRSTVTDLERILADMRAQDVDVLLVDLRNNPGGSLTEAIEVAGLFVGKGPVLMTRDGQGQVNFYEPQQDHAVWDRPVVMLTNKGTSGGGEIIAAAVRDYGRGIVVGDSSTNANGTVAMQTFVTELAGAQGPGDAERLGAARVTIQKFYRVSGDGFQGRGLTPDVVLPSLTEATLDTQAVLPYALAYDTVQPASFTPAGVVLDDAARKDLAEASAKRRHASAYFQRLVEQLEALRRRGPQLVVPLDQDKFRAYRQQIEAPPDDAAPLPGIPAVKLTPYLQEVLAVSLDYAAWRHFIEAKAALDQRKYTSAQQGFRRALAANPGMQRARYRLAWSLATLPDARFRDGDEAVTEARKLCALDGRKTWSYLLTLAVAEAEAGNFDQAQTELDAALAAAPASDGSKYTYLKERFRSRQRFSNR
jgi:carboxyl-terminal processing protease